MSAAHTPDRVVAVDGAYVAEVRSAKDGRVVARISSRGTLHISQEERDDARRLAACWNACEGISTDELEARAAIAQAQGEQP